MNGTEELDWTLVVMLALPLAIGTAFLIVKGLAASLTSVRARSGADDYAQSDSLKLRVSEDTLVDTRIERRPKPRENQNQRRRF